MILVFNVLSSVLFSEADGGNPVVRVFFKNGHEGSVATATSVRIEKDTNYAMVQPLVLLCFDSAKKEVGRFKWDELNGYAIE